MPIGPGKYDGYCTEIQQRTLATGVVLLVMGGQHGSGFSVQVTDENLLVVPDLLRTIADQMEADLRSGQPLVATPPRAVKSEI